MTIKTNCTNANAFMETLKELHTNVYFLMACFRMLCKHTKTSVWKSSGNYVQMHTFWYQSGPIWTYLGLSGPIWAYLDQVGPSRPNPYGAPKAPHAIKSAAQRSPDRPWGAARRRTAKSAPSSNTNPKSTAGKRSCKVDGTYAAAFWITTFFADN